MKNETKVLPWVQELVEDVIKPNKKLKIGAILMHPDGYKIKITDGQYWGTHGWSNFWHWRKVKKDGSLSRKEYSGYGW